MSADSLQLLLGIGTGVTQLAQGHSQAQQAEIAASYADQRAQQTYQAYSIATAKHLGSIRASYAAANVDPNRGSPADALAEVAYWEELDAQRAYFNAQREASAARRAGESAKLEGLYAFSGSILDVIGRGLQQTQIKGTAETPYFDIGESPLDLPGNTWQRET